MSTRFLLFQISVMLLLVGMQLYFYRAITRTTHRNSIRLLGAIAFGVFNLSLGVLLLIPLQSLPRWAIGVWIIPLYIWHFSFALLFLLLMAGKVVTLPFVTAGWIVGRMGRGSRWVESSRERIRAYDARRRLFLRRGAIAIAGAAFSGSAYGTWHRDQGEISSITLPVKNLGEKFDGFTIALISDIHSSVFMPEERMREYADEVNRLHADVIAVTGDFVNSMVDEVYPFARAFGVLAAPDGVFGVLGNHDYYTRDVESVAREVNACGIRLLRNDAATLKRGEDFLNILGVNDVGNSDRAARLFDGVVGKTAKGPNLLLCHRPYFFEEAASRHIDLTLSGHTHGGQIVFARIGGGIIAPARVASPYVAGKYSIGSSLMYVSRGIGTVGVPIRINCPPEITKITLVRG